MAQTTTLSARLRLCVEMNLMIQVDILTLNLHYDLHPNPNLSQGSEQAFVPKSRTSKKRKTENTNAGASRRKKGKLSGLLTMMPNEVMYQVGIHTSSRRS